jgi:dissimilatory sulfite reductase (desulfoviridin) alpha/beta subunit
VGLAAARFHTRHDEQIQMTTITLELSDAQAWALAQFVKRVGWSEFRSNAQDDNEADAIRDAVDQLQKCLTQVGFAPR